MDQNIRIRCQVLKTIANIGPCTTKEINEKLPHLSMRQIKRTCQRLNREDDEIKVIDRKPNPIGGTNYNVYQVRGEEEERVKIKDTRVRSEATLKKKTHRAKLQKSMHYDEKKARIIVFNRDKKIDLLTSLLKYVEGTRKDLLIGIINDYK